MSSACGSAKAPAAGSDEPPIPATAGGLALDRVFAAASGPGAVVGGFDGALATGRTLVVFDPMGHELGRSSADADGRFRVAASGAQVGDDLILRTEGQDAADVRIRVRDPARAMKEAVRAPIDGAGAAPNDLVIAGGRGILVRSGDNAVSPFDLAHGISGGTRLPALSGACGAELVADPWFVAPLDPEGSLIAVTAFGEHQVFVIDVGSNTVTRTLAAGGPVRLDAPFRLARPIDVDGDCTPDEEVSSFLPRAPQAVAVAGDHLAVGFTGFLAPRTPDGSSPPVYLPAVLAVWQKSRLELGPTLTVLDAFDPQEIRALDDQRFLVVCSGVLDNHAGMLGATTPGAVLIFDAGQNAITDRFDLGDFAPGTAIEAAGALWVGSLVKGALRRIDLADRQKTKDLPLGGEMIDSIFRLVDLDGGLLAVPSFDTDRLHVVDARTGELDPLPFLGPLEVGPGRPIFDGLQIVARRPGRRGIDFVGADLFALAGIASRVTPIELRKVLGP